MNLLLDTQALLWFVLDDPRLFTLLPISVSHTAQVVDLPFHHRDPFDRLIIAQSLVEGIPLVSSDDMFDHYGVERIW